MGLFDTIVKGVSDYLGSDDGDEMVDTFRGFFSDDGGGAEDGGGGGGGFSGFVNSFLGDSEPGGGEGEGGGFGGFVNSFLGDSESGGGEGGGGWGGTFGRIVDRLSGDGGREDVWDRAVGTVVDRVSQYLPEELRNVAGQYLGQGQGQGGPGGQGQGQGSSWSGSLVDQSQTQVPSGWHAVANHPTIGHSYGEGGFGGFLDHSIANLAGNHGMHPDYMISPQSPQMGNDDGIRYIRAPGIEPGQPLGNDGSADPRVTMPADALRGARYVDTDGDGYADRIYPAPGNDANGDGYPDRPLPRPGFDADGDGYPDGLPRSGDAAGFIGPEPWSDRDGDGISDEYDLSDSDRNGNGLPDAYERQRPVYDADGDGYPDGTDPIGGADIEKGGILGRSAADDRADYDDMVTSGAPAAPSQPAYQAPDDPTFPADDPGAAAVAGPAEVTVDQPAAEPPASDFQQSIDDANQVETSMDGMFDGMDGA